MGDPTQSAMGRRRDMGSEAVEKCYNVHHGLLRRLRVIVVVDNNSTRDLRQKPYQVADFGEGIEIRIHIKNSIKPFLICILIYLYIYILFSTFNYE